MAGLKHPVTPDGRYFVVRGKLWRMSNPCLAPDEKSRLVKQLMNARRAVKAAKAAGSLEAETAAHRLVDEAKRRLGERGRVWWQDEAPDFNRHAVKNSPYADWYARTKRQSSGRRAACGEKPAP
ncbi:hypothetical protein QIH96_43960 [Bradyrhizobium japonicum]|nr:hypothetical protein [Bradyrhizobium japonicum]WLB54779.1 hypothetical protein QIH94_01920 [Bradyrhizobium japonicum]WLB63346.1 hypothetical protein QIH96_43960 [Bradyrhizobium japonicum]